MVDRRRETGLASVGVCLSSGLLSPFTAGSFRFRATVNCRGGLSTVFSELKTILLRYCFGFSCAGGSLGYEVVRYSCQLASFCAYCLLPERVLTCVGCSTFFRRITRTEKNGRKCGCAPAASWRKETTTCSPGGQAVAAANCFDE